LQLVDFIDFDEGSMRKSSNGKRYYWQPAGKSAARLRSEFLALLEQDQSEKVYQLFLEENTRLVPREFVQNHGIHFKLILRKLSFGADYKSDFAYLSKSSDDWNGVLIEIERPGSKFFKTGTNDFHPDFLKSLQQINRWRAWFSDATNLLAFARNTVGLIRVPLERNPIHPKFVLVHGRRAEYASDRIRRSLVAAKEGHDFKIMTFDSLVEDLEAKNDLYLGVRRNEYIDIRSDVFLDESIFAWMPPEQIRIGRKLKEGALSVREQWHHYTTEDGLVMDKALRRVRYR
jgi:hypothetical protein